MNALANQLAGAGMEKTQNYRKAKRKFLGIENIHVMRDALYRVAKLPLIYLYGMSRSFAFCVREAMIHMLTLGQV